MTEPGQRLATAIAALCDPTTVRVDRLAITEQDRQAVRATNTEAAQAHREQLARYRGHLALYTAREDDAGVRRVQALIDRRETLHRAAIEQRRTAEAVVPSLLDRLHDAVQSTQGGGGASAGVHRAPIGLAAAELLAEIRREIGQRDGDLDAHLRAWKPDGSDDLDDAACMVAAWVQDGRAIIEPPRMSEARAACPNCGTRYVYVDEDGERVRKAAISINLTDGYAQCLNRACGTRWDRDHFDLLAAVLRQDQGAKP